MLDGAYERQIGMVMARIFSQQSSSIFGYSPSHSGKRAMPTTLKEGGRAVNPGSLDITKSSNIEKDHSRTLESTTE